MTDILTLLARAARDHPGAPAIVDDSGSLGFDALARATSHVRDKLWRQGLKPGTTIVLRMGQARGWAPALLGAWQAGLRVAIVNPALPAATAQALVERCRAGAVIEAPEPERSADALPSVLAPASRETINEATFADIDADDATLIVFSSGSTGLPKGIVHTRHSLDALLSLTFALYPRALDLFSVPLAGLGGVQMLALCLRDGLPLRVLGDLSQQGIVEAIDRYQPAHVLLFPAHIAGLVAAAVDRPGLLSSVRFCHSGGDTLPTELWRSFRRLTGVGIAHAYGMAECGPVLKSVEDDPNLFEPIAPDRTALSLDVSLGTSPVAPGPHDAGTHAPVGELLVRGPSRMLRYLGEPDACASPYEAFRTGELFRLVAPGRIAHVGRATEGARAALLRRIEERFIHLGGPSVEAYAMEDEGVLKVFVSGVEGQHDDLLSRLHADAAGLSLWSDIQLTVLPAFPLGPTGKVDRQALRALAS